MSDLSARLGLPLLKPSQAQKHVTHNEALQLLDALVQAVVEETGAETPPFAPVDGQVFALGANPTGDWAGESGNLALRVVGAWLFLTPRAGWRVWDKASGVYKVHDGAGWVGITPDTLQNMAMVGINTTADATNRLSVTSPAVLFNNEGAGHRLKINKAAAGDTASLLFQSGFTGHAEMGLAGVNDWSIKVSPDGTTWTEALVIDKTTGHATVTGTMSAGAFVGDGAGVTNVDAQKLDGLNSTAFLRSNVDDTMTGNLTVTGQVSAGSLSGDGSAVGAVDAVTLGGLGASTFVRTDADSTITADLTIDPSASGPGGNLSVAGDVSAASFSGAGVQASATDTTAGRLARADYAYSPGNLVGTVSQSGGTPTGAVIEQGSNANGEYVRFADGTQICTIKRLTLTQNSAAACNATWTYPAAFADATVAVHLTPIPGVDTDGPVAFDNDATPNQTEIMGPRCGNLSASSVSVAMYRISGMTDFVTGDQLYVSGLAVGRWY